MINKENILSLKTHINKKDLEAFSQALIEQTIKLQIENQQLKEKLEHLEKLLKNVDVPIISKFDSSSVLIE